MKRFVCFSLAILMITAVAFASPFVASDPDPGHVKHRVRISQDGTTWGQWVEGQPSNQHLWFDFGGIAPGNYFGEAQAYMQYAVTDTVSGAKTTVEEWSASTPFSFQIPTGIRGIKIVK